MKVRIEARITPQWQRANERAAIDRAAGRLAVRVAPRIYHIPSETGNEPRVVTITSVVNLQASCTCPAGERNIPCKHAAQALSAAVRHIAQCERQPVASAAPAPLVAPDRQGDWFAAQRARASA